jgi:hypothetical protein
MTMSSLQLVTLLHALSIYIILLIHLHTYIYKSVTGAQI